MAVAAADFYTYARATGTPLPQNKKEEAELVPAINQWKRNQLRQQRQEENNINGGAIAAVAGLAGLGAAALAASRGGLRTRVTNAVDPTSGSRISTGVGGLQQDLNEKVTQSRDWDDYRDSITLKTKVDERDFVNEALDKVERDAIRQSSLADYTPQELAALEQATPRVSEKVRRANIREGGEKVRQNMIRGLELPEPSWEQTSVVQNRQPEVRAISPKEVLALPSAITDEGYTAPQKTWSEYRYAGPDALESLADEQLDIIRGTSPTGGSAIENAERSAELNRQAQMRRSVPAEGGQRVLRDLFAKPQVSDPWDTPVVTNNNVKTAVTANDFLLEQGPRRYIAPIDPEKVTNNSVANVPKSTTTEDQTISAIKSAEDQITGRIYNKIVTDPNVDTSNLDDVSLQTISQSLPVPQEEKRLGVAEQVMSSLQRVSDTKPLNTGTFLDNFLGNLPAGIVLADEVGRRGAGDIANTARGITKLVKSNLPKAPSGTNTSATVQLSDGSAAGPLYPFKQLVRGLTGNESVDVVTPKNFSSEFENELLETARVKKNTQIRDEVIKEQIQSKRELLEAQGLRGTRLERALQSDPEVQGLLNELATPPKVVLPGQKSTSLPPEEITGVKSVQNVRDLDYNQGDFYDPDNVVIDKTAQGSTLRGGKITGGEMKYQDAGGQWVTDDITKRPTESKAPVEFTDYSYIDDQNNKRTITAREKGLNYQAIKEGNPEAIKKARQAVELSEAQRIASDPRRVEQRTGRPARPQYMIEEQRRATKNQDPSIPLGGAMVTLRDELQQLGPQEQRPVLRQGADGVEYYDLPDPKTGKDYTKNTVGAVETSSAFTGPARFASGPVKGSQSLPEVGGDSSLYVQREIQPTQKSDSVLKIVDYANNPSGQLQQINTAKIGPIGLPEQNVGSLPKGVELVGRPREAAMNQAQDFVADALARTTVTDAPVVYPSSDITGRLAATQSPSLPPGYNLSRSTGQLIQNPQISRGVVEQRQSFAGLNPKLSREDVNTYQIGQSTSTPVSPFIGPMGERVITPVYPGVSNPPQRVSSLAYVPKGQGSILGRRAQSPLPGQSVDNPARWLQTPTAGGAKIAYPHTTDDPRLSNIFPRAGADATILRTIKTGTGSVASTKEAMDIMREGGGAAAARKAAQLRANADLLRYLNRGQ